ncbi:ATP-binding cassette domain-containing protein [Modestobacter sp. VKM Ac-2977]|uniref:ABC transporter ATP-binding protein n=1 Tax=Modestobacter sp. VKM Ac-2977 TaxID=3004131 RepID=UPI0022AACA91|nr:ATP-binding cassette domain-containing protein [Modestobacter sp. VKM Ac-2977]MCZ2819823.1 ATP-binding cassette domain-containing protein [Modestobacter sp. VKM Ac-2977]
MIEVRGLRKAYGGTVAVHDVALTAAPGRVTGFLGPNGAGKSTTMRLLLGLEQPDAGSVRVNGQAPADLRWRLHEVGALLDGRAAIPGLTPRAHLRSLALTHGIPRRRVDEVLELVGLASVATRRIRGFSLGMGQRLGLAAALLGNPHTLVLDEPINGLDPDGVIWVRQLLRHLAGQGTCVLLSSHLMGEMAQTVDDLVLIAQGRVVAAGPLADLLRERSSAQVLVRAHRTEPLGAALTSAGAMVTAPGDGSLEVRGLSADEVGQVACDARVPLSELRPLEVSLEQAYLELTRDQAEYTASVPGRQVPA